MQDFFIRIYCLNFDKIHKIEKLYKLFCNLKFMKYSIYIAKK